MRVVYSFPHVIGRPGIGTTALQQVRSLAARGASVEVWCAASAARLPDGVAAVETFRHLGVRIPQRTVGTFRSYRLHDRTVARALRSGRLSADVVHTWPLGALETLRTAGALGIATVREVPNTHTENAVRESSAEWRRLGLTPPRGHSHTPDAQRLRIEEQEYAASRLLLTPSSSVAASFLSRGFREDHLFRHRYGFDPDVFTPAPQTAGRPFTAVFAGAGDPRKGLHHALEAWQASGVADHGRLLVCGTLERRYAELLAAALSHASVTRLGFCPDLARVLARADVLILPSVEEGSALVVYEAMGSGAVPLVSEAAGAPVRHGIDGLVHRTRAVDELAGHLRLLAGDRDCAAAMRQSALKASEDLTWYASGGLLLDAYAAAVAATASPRTPLTEEV